jgi:hypothetical protein
MPRRAARLVKVEAVALSHMRQHNRKLARERHFRLLHAGAFGKPHRPALECAALDWPRQEDMSGLLKNGTYRTVTYLVDPAGDVGFTQALLSVRAVALREFKSLEKQVRTDRNDTRGLAYAWLTSAGRSFSRLRSRASRWL